MTPAGAAWPSPSETVPWTCTPALSTAVYVEALPGTRKVRVGPASGATLSLQSSSPAAWFATRKEDTPLTWRLA